MVAPDLFVAAEPRQASHPEPFPDHYGLMEEPPFISENGAIGMPVLTWTAVMADSYLRHANL